MSYDLLCYPSKSGTPQTAEAEGCYNSDYRREVSKDLARDLKQKIATALMQHNPRLHPSEFLYAQIAQRRNISEEQARRLYCHIELTPPAEDPAIQITIYDDHVDLTLPFWYKGDKAVEVFAELQGYLRVIGETAGFFVYDRQAGIAFDPLVEELNRETYDGAMRIVPSTMARSGKRRRRPWWKFW